MTYFHTFAVINNLKSIFRLIKSQSFYFKNACFSHAPGFVLCDSRQWMNKNACIKCWCGVMKSSNLDGLFSIHSPPSSILNSKCFILTPPTSNLFHPTSFLYLQLFFLHPQSKERDFLLKKSSK